MAMASFCNISSISTHFSSHLTHTQTNFYHYNHSSLPSYTIKTHHEIFTFFSSKFNQYPASLSTFMPTHLLNSPVSAAFSAGNGGGFPGSGGGGGGGDGDSGGGEEEERDRNREEAMLVLAEAGRSLESFPADLAVAVKAGRVPGSIVRRFFELEESVVFRWLLKFGGFKERLLADDLFLTKLVMECVVVIFTK
ncbi:hypothetical protein A2U01_0019647, partial [Trifolium medium]|nr:hypothetical protein [Trifolium medium]